MFKNYFWLNLVDSCPFFVQHLKIDNLNTTFLNHELSASFVVGAFIFMIMIIISNRLLIVSLNQILNKLLILLFITLKLKFKFVFYILYLRII